MNLSPAQSRAAALMLLLAVLAAAVAFGVSPLWRTYSANREAIDEHRTLIERFSRLADEHTSLEAQRRALEHTAPVDRFLIDAASATLAAAQLQESLKEIVENSGGRLTSTQVLGAQPQGGFERIAINVRMSADTAGLQKILHRLESSLPVLQVGDLTVYTRRNRGRRKAKEPRRSTLDIRFSLLGFVRTKPTAEASS